MAYSFLKPETLVKTFKESKKYTEGLTDGFFEYERIARNKPHGSIPKEYPKTTDGTTASIIRKTPHRIIQQLPTGKVKSDTNDWLSIVAEFIYTHKIIPNANEGYALLQKCWTVVERFLTFGSCATYAPFVEHGGYFCADLRLPYWGDIFLQPGKLSDEDSNYVFMRSWWQPEDLEALIDTQSKLGKDVEQTWDVEALKKIKEIVTSKDEKSKTPTERAGNSAKGGVELITGFQRGVKSKFYTFHIQNTGTGSKPNYEGTIVRTKVNKDPRGEFPISFAYGDIDGSNPLGRSVIDLVGGMQNLMDGEIQMYQYNRALQLNPPLIKRGNFSKNKIKFAPNVIIDVGSDPNSTVEALKIDTTALANFPQNYGLMQSQIFQLLATPNSTISSDVGSVSQSKTPQGVEQNKANLSIDDNYVRKQFETWFERWSETAINLYFAERTGVEELQLDEDTADKLKQLAANGRFDLSMLSDDNMIRIDYSSATEKLQFKVDPTSSKKQDDAEQLQLLQDAMKMVTPQANYYMGLDGWKLNLGETYKTILSKMGIENIDKLVTRMTPQEIQQAQQAPFPIIDPPQIRLTGQIPPGAMPGALSNGGIEVKPGQMDNDQPVDLGDIYKDKGTPASVKAQIQQLAGLTPDEQGTAQATDPITPDHVLQADQQAHQQEMDKADLMMQAHQQAHAQALAETQHELATKQANKPKTGVK